MSIEIQSDIRVVVSIDFGTTFSGYAYAHKENPKNITVQSEWETTGASFKTPTVIKDYLKKLGDHIKESLERHWRNVDFYKHVLIVLTVPAEFDDKAIETFRECAINAGLLKDKYNTNNLKFTTEPEAAAICCLNPTTREEHHLTTGDSFMIVDCGGGTVDLTTRELLEDERLSEITERSGDYCGSSFIDQAFLEIKEEFGEIVPNISVPPQPITSVVKGGVLYGLKEKTVKDRILKRTYGTEIVRRWKQPDPLSERLPNGLTVAFERLAQRGARLPRDNKFTKKFKPLSLLQQKINFDLYATEGSDAKFCEDPGVSKLHNWEIELPENENLEDTTILFTLSFGVGIEATAENQKTGKKYQCEIKYE
ncbi:unnamed protein product [Rhizophagus irregularis]|nr:unnamed protein product [Rhizophagus irregularis]